MCILSLLNLIRIILDDHVKKCVVFQYFLKSSIVYQFTILVVIWSSVKEASK